MYNEDMKKRFITYYTKSLHTAEVARTIFDAIEPYELAWGADLCTIDPERLQPMINSITGLRNCSKWMPIIILREYSKWCEISKIPGACDGLMHIDTLGFEKIKKQMVASPYHLQKYFDEVFDSEAEETIDNIYRCYLWMAYEGVKEDDAIAVKNGDIDFRKMIISVNGLDIPIRREALDSIRNAVELTSFVYKHPNYCKPVRRDRVAGDIVLRGIKSNVQLMTIRSTLSKRLTDSHKQKKTDLQLSFYRIWLSGLFYRMYERERAGVPADFSEIAAREITRKQYSLEGITSKQRENRRARDYMDDYQRWKLAFSI